MKAAREIGIPGQSASLPISAAIGIAGILLAVAACQFSAAKVLFLFIALAGVAVLLWYPEWALVLFFSSALIKEWLVLNVPLFAQFDFTLAIFLLSATSLFLFLLRKGYLFEFPLHRSMLPLFLFTGWMFFSVIYTPSFQYGSAKAFSFLLFNWALFFFPILLVRTEQNAIRLIAVFALLAFFVTTFTLVSLVQSLFSGSIIYSYRASFLGINPISFANWVGAVAIILITYLPQIEKRALRRGVVITIGLLIMALFVANSRGPLISFLASFAWYAMMRFRRTSKRKVIRLVLLLLLFVIIVLIVLPEQLTSRYTDLLSQEEGNKNYTLFTINTRIFGWKAALEMGTANLFTMMFGVGNGGFSQTIYRQDIRWYPHNMFLEVFCELGLLGLLLLIWHLAAIGREIRLVLRQKLDDRSHSLFFAFTLAAFFNFVNAQFSGDLNDNRRFWFFLGMVLALRQVFHSRGLVKANGSNE